ncbi:hypothetical protein [Magnetospirillum sp. UT-4]|uniref:hypothetical protein n=1 Tax=Magnetospirillum sp. UT-4 TaxID=2681467 RepID=UPI00137F02A1|nr:hypothetical protein [Magnetospirillum sp. UT-4]CAA7624333.1 conserved hypothetical protein [Magnetospirillum sp. UT-4]
MVDDIENAVRVQAAMVVQVAPAVTGVAPVSETAKSANDPVDLSTRARSLVQELQGSQTVAEAWLQQKTAPAEITDPSKSDNQDRLLDPAAKDEEKRQQKALKQSFDTVMSDIAWLFDALGAKKVDGGPIAEAISRKAAAAGVGTRPPVHEVVLRAEQGGGAAALYVENLHITVQKGEVTKVEVERVALTNVHDTLRDRFSGTGRPLVLDVGGELQQVGGTALGADRTADVVISPKARADKQPGEDVAARDRATPLDDPRHALLIVREGGKLHPEGTLRLKLDALLPIR